MGRPWISNSSITAATLSSTACGSKDACRAPEAPITNDGEERMNLIEMETDVLVVGGGTAGPMAAVKAKEANPKLRVMLLEKANVKRSGAISMGMDGLNNAVIPGHATPEQYTKEITIANDGIVNQKGVYAYASNSYAMIEEL